MDAMKPYLVLLLISSIYAGMYMVSKAAFDEGMSTFVFVFYRQAIATVFLVPVALVSERKKAPPLSYKMLLKMFLLSLIGITTSLNIYGVAITYTSATVASATTNSVPVITFFMAVVLGLERLKVKSASGMAKLIGVMLCMGGVFTIAFYKGALLKLRILHPYYHTSSTKSMETFKGTWMKGTFLMITSNSAWSLWVVLQGKILMEYPSKLLFTALQCVFSAIQALCIGAIFERRFSKWKLGFDVGLLAVTYSGIVVTGISFYLQAWCIEKRGPVFLAMSTSLAFVITAIFSALLLEEFTSLGSVLGGLLMVGGLYSVLWGKRKEQKCEVKLPVVDAKDAGSEENETASPFHSI